MPSLSDTNTVVFFGKKVQRSSMNAPSPMKKKAKLGELFRTSKFINGADGLPMFPANYIDIAIQKCNDVGLELDRDINDLQTNHRFIVGGTPLIHFCYKGDLQMCQFLFAQGADLTICGGHFESIFKYINHVPPEGKDCSPMYAAASSKHLHICQWLFEVGGDTVKGQISGERYKGDTPLCASLRHGGTPYTPREVYRSPNDVCYKWFEFCPLSTSQWLLKNGGGVYLSPGATFLIRNSGEFRTFLLWVTENLQFHRTFLQFLGGTIIWSISSDSSNPLQLLTGQPGVMELIGDYAGLIKGQEMEYLQEFATSMDEEENKDMQLGEKCNDFMYEKRDGPHNGKNKVLVSSIGSNANNAEEQSDVKEPLAMFVPATELLGANQAAVRPPHSPPM